MSKVLIIAEAGVNHNGQLALALQLCDAAKHAGVDIVKFQTWKTEKLLTKSAAMADYQKENTGSDKSQFDMIKELELGYSEFRHIQAHCRKIGIEFLSTPDEEESLDFLVDELGLSLIKVGSGEVTNTPYLRHIGAKQKPVLLSTGMSYIGEVERALQTLRAAGAPEVSLLHCTTNYPCPMNEVNLRAMNTLGLAFNVPVGYSDHTLGIEVSVAAVALGATIIEKHFTLDRSMPGPDHSASLNPAELAEMVRAIRNIEDALGDGVKQPNASEIKIKPVVRRSIVASRLIAVGEHLQESNLTIKRAGGAGIPAELWDNVVGRKASKAYREDDLVEL